VLMHCRMQTRRGCRLSVLGRRRGCCTVGFQSVNPGLVTQRIRGKEGGSRGGDI
jgi:hypothetical protein